MTIQTRTRVADEIYSFNDANFDAYMKNVADRVAAMKEAVMNEGGNKLKMQQTVEELTAFIEWDETLKTRLPPLAESSAYALLTSIFQNGGDITTHSAKIAGDEEVTLFSNNHTALHNELRKYSEYMSGYQVPATLHVSKHGMYVVPRIGVETGRIENLIQYIFVFSRHTRVVSLDWLLEKYFSEG